MTDLIEILREEAKWGNTYSGEILARIEKLEEERDNAKYLFQQYFQLSREASDESDARIEKLEAALREIHEVYAGSEGIPEPMTAAEGYLLRLLTEMVGVTRKALEGKDD